MSPDRQPAPSTQGSSLRNIGENRTSLLYFVFENAMLDTLQLGTVRTVRPNNLHRVMEHRKWGGGVDSGTYDDGPLQL